MKIVSSASTVVIILVINISRNTMNLITIGMLNIQKTNMTGTAAEEELNSNFKPILCIHQKNSIQLEFLIAETLNISELHKQTNAQTILYIHQNN